MANQSNAFESSFPVAAGMERAAIERAFQTVIAYVTSHHDGMKGTLRKKSQDF
jgi:hypothetical protein